MGNRTAAVQFFNQGIAALPTDAALAFRLFASAVYVDADFPEGWYMVGCALGDQGLHNASVAAYRRAVEAKPDDVKSWSNLGHRLYFVGRQKEARAATMRAIELAPEMSHPWANLSMIQSVAGENREAIKSAQKAYALEPCPTTEMALAFAHLYAGDWATGLKHFESRYAYRFKQFETYPYPKWEGEPELQREVSLSVKAAASSGDAEVSSNLTPPQPSAPSFNGRTPEFDSGNVGSTPTGAAMPGADRQQPIESAGPMPAAAAPVVAGEPTLSSQVQGAPPNISSPAALPVPAAVAHPFTLLITAEQGIGDTLSFARFVPKVMERIGIHFTDDGKPHGGRLILQVQKELTSLFKAMFEQRGNPDEQDAGAVQIIPTPGPFVAADRWTTPTSLPVWLGLTNQEIENTPFPKIPAFETVPTWKIPGRKLHVGIAWAGSPHNDIDRWRSIDVKHFLDLAAVEGVQLYGLQVGDRAADAHNVGAAAIIHDLQQHILEVKDTVAVLKHLDLVICCESMLAHLAGSMQQEVWVPYSYNGRDFRIGNALGGQAALWYPRHRIYRQGYDQDWRPVFAKMARDLEKRVERADRLGVAAQ